MSNAEVPIADQASLESELRRRLRPKLEKIAEDGSILRPSWEPLLDSQRVVGAVTVLEGLIAGIKLPPDRIVREGGYNDVDEALADIAERVIRLVTEAKSKEKEQR